MISGSGWLAEEHENQVTGQIVTSRGLAGLAAGTSLVSVGKRQE